MERLAPRDFGPEPTWYPCTRCRELHALENAVCWDCRRAAERAAGVRRRRQAALETLPPDFAWARFGAPELAARVTGGIATIERGRLAARTKRVVLFGPAGRGKTSLAVAMMREWVEQTGELALFVPSILLSGGAFELTADQVSASLVVIDDMGGERELKSCLVPDLVTARHAKGLATWVTTWMTPAQVGERYGDGIRRRLYERGVVVVVGGLG